MDNKQPNVKVFIYRQKALSNEIGEDVWEFLLDQKAHLLTFVKDGMLTTMKHLDLKTNLVVDKNGDHLLLQNVVESVLEPLPCSMGLYVQRSDQQSGMTLWVPLEHLEQC